MFARLLVVAILVSASAVCAHADAVTAVAVTACGQVIPARATGVLQGDLDCPAGGAQVPYAVTLEDRAVLELDGHRLSGGGTTVRLTSTGSARRWTVRGPGEISGGGVFAESGADAGACIEIPAGLLAISNVTLRSCEHGLNGLMETGGALQRQSRVRASHLIVEKSAAPVAIHVFRLEGNDVIVRDNAGDGIHAYEVRGTDIEATNNGVTGLYAESRVNIRRLKATGNGDLGVFGGHYLLLDQSTVTGNDVGSGGIDIVSETKPLLRRTSCGRSARAGDGGVTFGVCADD